MWGSRGLLLTPVGSRGKQRPSGGQGTSPPETEGFFLNLRYEKPRFPALYPVSNSQSQNTLYCALRLSSRGKKQAQTKVYIQRLYTPNLTITVAHIITFLSGHMCLSTYVGRSSCQQLTNDSIQKRKANLVIAIAPGNKISKVSNE